MATEPAGEGFHDGHTAIALVSPPPALLAEAERAAESPSAASASSSSSSSGASSPASSTSSSAASSSDDSSSSSEDSSSAASSSPSSSSAASSYASSPAASALEEGKAKASGAGAGGRGKEDGLALPGTPHSNKTTDSDIRTLPTTPFAKSCLCRCLAVTTAVLTVLGIILGILVQQRVLWFIMPMVEYERGGSSFQLSTLGPAGEVGGVEYATDFYMTIGVKVENPNNYALTFSDVSMALTDFRAAYVGTASHEDAVTIPPRKAKTFLLNAEIHTTLPEIMMIAQDCERNGMATEIQAKGSLRAQIIPNVISVPIKMGPYKTTINCAVNGPDGKPLVGADGHIHLPDHLQEETAEPAAPEATEAVEGEGEGEAPVAVAIEQPAAGAPGDVAIEPVPAAAEDGGGAAPADAPPAPPAPPAEAEAPPAPPAPLANDNNGGGNGGGFLRGIFGWGN